MTAPGGGDPHRDQPDPWPQYQHPPVDPQEPVNYPDYPPAPPYPGPQPPQSPYSYPPPPPYGGPGGYGVPPSSPYGSPGGYGAPPPYSYDPYQSYGAGPHTTNGLAVASLITSIAGVVLGIPLAIFCFVGWLIPVAAAVMGAVALSQIKRTGQEGRGLAIAGVVVGSGTAALLLLFMAMYTAAALHTPVFVR